MEYQDYLPKLNKTAEKYKDKAQQELKYCITCQPYDGGDYIWIAGNETTIDEILESVKCPEHYRVDIAAHLICPNCGKSGFEQFDVAGTEDVAVLAEERKYQYIITRFADKLDNFRSHIEKYPSLALAHPMGKKIYKEITNSNLDSIKVKHKMWARARLVSQSKVFEQTDMTAPQVGLSSGGRFHHQGQSVLYLAETDELAMIETLDNPDISSLIWIQKYSQKRELTGILDLRHEWSGLGYSENEVIQALLASRYIFDKVVDRSSKWRPQYFLTTFIADCARQAGFKGIIYSSSRSIGSNLILFNPNEPAVKPVENPKVYIYEPKKGLIEDMNDITLTF
ncbi:RES family NAD+ phosphorylase [Sutcliffiella horikoshii]|uniref:RES family NAD+ phosphorylase n=1 Tax=Sutcliffiella horikoshii TaxID=79883 RepID=UPI001CBEB7A2|nr:RES family NAD+ phosphorylase [Sutcliffiella horikoshii]UAL45562.1 RES family NAD+ phosphorylase [Sutcliffiella horikoshii]